METLGDTQPTVFEHVKHFLNIDWWFWTVWTLTEVQIMFLSITHYLSIIIIILSIIYLRLILFKFSL